MYVPPFPAPSNDSTVTFRIKRSAWYPLQQRSNHSW